MQKTKEINKIKRINRKPDFKRTGHVTEPVCPECGEGVTITYFVTLPTANWECKKCNIFSSYIPSTKSRNEKGQFKKIKEPKTERIRLTEDEKEHIIAHRKEIRAEKVEKAKILLAENWDKYSTWETSPEPKKYGDNLQFDLESVEEELKIDFLEIELLEIAEHLQTYLYNDNRYSFSSNDDFTITVSRSYATISFSIEED